MILWDILSSVESKLQVASNSKMHAGRGERSNNVVHFNYCLFPNEKINWVSDLPVQTQTSDLILSIYIPRGSFHIQPL